MTRRQIPDPVRISDRVHYVSHGTPFRPDGSQAYASVCRAATVTELPSEPTGDNRVGLEVANPTGHFFRPLEMGGCAYGNDPGQWHHVH